MIKKTMKRPSTSAPAQAPKHEDVPFAERPKSEAFNSALRVVKSMAGHPSKNPRPNNVKH